MAYENYGPWNALADVLGAYIQKRSIDGAMKYADEFGKQVNDLQQQKMKMNQVQTEQGADVKADAMERMRRSGVMPDTDWLHQNGPKPLKYGLDAAFERVSAPQTATPLAGNTPAQPAAENAFQFKAPSLMEAAGMYQPKSNPLGVDTSFPIQSNKPAVAPTTTPTTSATVAPAAKPYDPEFAAQQKAHPEWFVGNTYVGDDMDARKNAYLAAGQKKVDAYKQQQNAPYTGSTLNMMQEFARRNSQAPQSAQSYADKSMDQFQFQKNQKEHPEWFVGDRYIGDKLTGDKAKDDKVRQDAALLNQQTAQEKAQLVGPGQSYKFKSGMEKYGATGEMEKPLSYNEFVSKTKELKTHAMREMISKYGEDAAAKAEKLIDQAIADKQGAYADKVDMQSREQLYAAFGDTTTAKGMQKALYAAIEYNKVAKRLGRDGIDTAMLGKILESGDVQLVTKNVGDKDVMFAVNKNGKAFDYDAKGNAIYYKPVAELIHGVNPDTKANIISKEKTNAENNRVKLQTVQMQNENRLQVAQISAAARSRGGSGGNGSSAEKQRYTQLRNWVKDYEDSHKNDIDDSWKNSNEYQTRKDELDGYTRPQYDFSDKQNQMSFATDLVAAANPDGSHRYTREEVENTIRSNCADAEEILGNINWSDWQYD